MDLDSINIKKQMEYYFSDRNLCKDDYLRERIAVTDNGFININLF